MTMFWDSVRHRKPPRGYDDGFYKAPKRRKNKSKKKKRGKRK
jgi:hypothetical protein